MEKRSRRRIRDLVALAAFQGLSENEIGCARISMMARSDAAPFKGRIQKRKTNHLQIITFGLQRTAGPYKSAITRPQRHSAQMFRMKFYRSCSATVPVQNSPLDASRNRFGRSQVAMVWRPFTLFEARGIKFCGYGVV